MRGASRISAEIYCSALYAESPLTMEVWEMRRRYEVWDVFHAMSAPEVNGLFMARNTAAGLQIWRAFRVVRHVNTPCQAIRDRNGP
jgi:hypothetical protein